MLIILEYGFKSKKKKINVFILHFLIMSTGHSISPQVQIYTVNA